MIFMVCECWMICNLFVIFGLFRSGCAGCFCAFTLKSILENRPVSKKLMKSSSVAAK